MSKINVIVYPDGHYSMENRCDCRDATTAHTKIEDEYAKQICAHIDTEIMIANMTRLKYKEVVLRLLERETGEVYAVNESTKLHDDLLLDSLDIAGLILHIERHFDINIENEEFVRIELFNDLLDLISRKVAAKSFAKANSRKTISITGQRSNTGG